VICRRPDPSGFITQTSIRPVKAMRRPSGDQWLFHAIDEPSVICCACAPSGADTISRVAVHVPAM